MYGALLCLECLRAYEYADPLRMLGLLETAKSSRGAVGAVLIVARPCAAFD
jgi:hypothetical protein